MTLIVSIKDKDIEFIKFPPFGMEFYTIRDEYIIYYRGIPFTGRIVYSAVNEDMGEEMFQGISKERISSFTDNDKFIIKDYINKISNRESSELLVPRIKWVNSAPPVIEKELEKKSSVLSKEPDKHEKTAPYKHQTGRSRMEEEEDMIDEMIFRRNIQGNRPASENDYTIMLIILSLLALPLCNAIEKSF